MEMPPLIYAVIVTWNSRRDIRDCLHSVLASRDVQLRVVVVDNGSTDGTAEIVASEFPELALIRNEQNRGFTEGNNIGIRYALAQGTEYVFLLNADAFVQPNTLAQMVGTAEAIPEIGMVGPSIVSYFDPGYIYNGARIDLDIVTAWEEQGARRDTMFDTDYVPGCAVLVRASALDKIGLLDPAYYSYWEDADWGIRCRRAGLRTVITPSAAVLHKGTLDQVRTKTDFALYFYTRNRYLFACKFKSRWDALRFFKRYTCDMLRQVSAQDRNADAIINGWWAAGTRQYGSRMVHAPEFLRRLIRHHPQTLLQLLHPIDTLRSRLPVRTTLRRVRARL
jgi:GT2 family glycosyltransferase